MSFADMTPEQRKAAQAKAAETRRANKAKRLAEPAPVEEPEVEEPLVLKAEPDDLWDGLLTDEDKAELDALAAKKAREDQKKAVKAAYAKEALDRERRKIGATPADEAAKKHMEEMVRIYIDMPRLRKPGGGEHAPEPIIIDQVAYIAGRYAEMPRGRALYVMWLMDQARRHVNAVDGRSRSYYDPSMHQVVHMGGIAAGGGMGPSFDAIHKRTT